jgi:diacylglycerol kinase (ATP)
MIRYIRKFKEGVIFSLAGFKVALKESAFQLELMLGIPAIIFALLSSKSSFEKALLVFSILLVLIVELCNTAIEKAIDRISLDHHHLSKKAKDVASCMVFFSAIAAASVWVIIYFL